MRVLLLLGMDLTVDEAYYWCWSRRLDWGYLDNCPMVAWIIKLAISPGELGLRLPFILIGAAPIVFAALIARQLTKNKMAPVVASILTATMPMLVLAGSLATHDAPQIALYSCATWLVLSASGTRWLTAGILWGLATLDKWSSILLVPCLALCAFIEPTLRKELRTLWPYFGVLIGLAIIAPFLIWNWQHECASFRFFYDQRMLANPTPVTLLHALILGPGPILLLVALYGFARERSPQWKRLTFITVVPVILVICLALRGRIDTNWLDFLYPGLCAAGAAKLVEVRKFGVVLIALIVAPWVVLEVIQVSEIRQPRLFAPTFSYIEKLHGWPQLATDLSEFKNDYIISPTYMVPSALAYHGGFEHFGPTFHKDSQWTIWNEQLQPGQRKVIISHRQLSEKEKLALKIVGKEAKTYDAKFSGQTIRRLWVYLPETQDHSTLKNND